MSRFKTMYIKIRFEDQFLTPIFDADFDSNLSKIQSSLRNVGHPCRYFKHQMSVQGFVLFCFASVFTLPLIPFLFLPFGSSLLCFSLTTK
ncbi:hypothetical protein QVD17_26515 [Tagetes erecta]|uniref:Uncharacterized protein n=1 Tax=Tagetes erecta TaxID=13708 RepID=A0AAD8K7J4_TARER|nr:hypothetical protein QVD17_26515 [Tagetes erecta]